MYCQTCGNKSSTVFCSKGCEKLNQRFYPKAKELHEIEFEELPPLPKEAFELVDIDPPEKEPKPSSVKRIAMPDYKNNTIWYIEIE